MIGAELFLGYPKEFKNLCLIYPPKIKDIITNKNFGVYTNLLTITQEDIQDLYAEKDIQGSYLTPMQYLFNLYYNDKNSASLIKEAFQFFIHEDVILLPEKQLIIIGDLDNLKGVEPQNWRMLTPDIYFDFQNSVREALGEKAVEMPRLDEDPRVTRIKAKARYRERIKAKNGGNLSLTALLASILCMGIGLNPLNIGEISYASAKLILRYYQQKDKYETDIKSLLAGAKNIKLENWIKNIED